MRLLYVSGTYAVRAYSGSELSAHTLLKGLSSFHGVDVLVASDMRYTPGRGRTREYDGIRILGIDHETRVADLHEAVSGFAPDLIYTQPWWHDVALKVGKERNVATMFRVTDWPIPTALFTDPATSPSAVVVQTREVENAVRAVGGRTILLPAFIDLARVRSRYPVRRLWRKTMARLRRRSWNHRRFITMFNPIEVKGGFLFSQIAQAMPDREFAVVPGWNSLRDESGKFDTERLRRALESHGFDYDGSTPPEPDFSGIPNVTVLTPRERVVEILDETRILLVPSLWKEQFGRVAFEAAANGAAVLASGIDSMRENAGDAALYVDDFRSVGAWTEAIRGLDDPGTLADQSARGQDYVLRNYDLEPNVSHFYDFARGIVEEQYRGSSAEREAV